MSGDSEVPNLKPKESENTVPENSDEKTGGKLKRNYCYVCKVQCTALRNFLEHQKGRKHLKKLESQGGLKNGGQEEIKRVKTKKGLSKKNPKISNSARPHEQNSQDFEGYEINNSHTDISNSADKGMSYFKKQNPWHKKNHYNTNNQKNFSRHQNSKYSYSNHYEGNQEYYYNEHPMPPYTRWRASQYQNHPPIQNPFNNYGFAPGGQYYNDPGYNASFQNEYFSDNGNDNFRSDDYTGQDPHMPFNSDEADNSVSNSLKNKIPEVGQLKFNSVSSENANKSISKDNSNSTKISEDFNSEQNLENNSDQSSTSTIEADQVVSLSLTISQTSNSSDSKVGEKKRLRTRSLISAESSKNTKRLKDKSERLSVDSDGTSEEQKLKEYTTSLLETNPNRISLMIQHPSSHKEKAVLNHIMTSFSKTKRKENLTKKLRSNSLGSVENNEDATCDVLSVSSENEEISVIMPAEEISAQINTDSDRSKYPPIVKKVGNCSKDHNSDLMLNNKDRNQSSKKSSKVNSKSKENSSSESRNKAPERRKEKNSECVYPKNTVKRKRSDDNTDNKGKKQRIREGKNIDVSCRSRTAEQMDLNQDMTPTVDHASQPEIVSLKEETVECSDMNQAACLLETEGASQNQILDFNAQISVETLIELFASGNVAVKREFNDPAIDAIKGVDPNELMSACSNDSHLNSIAERTHKAIDPNVIGSKSTTSVPNFSVSGVTNCINPVILGSTVDSDNITPVSMTQMNIAAVSKPSPNEKSKDQNSSIMSDASEKDSLSEVERLNLISRTKSEFPHLIALIEKLQEIASKEETVKENIIEAKLKINEYSSLLEEWKNKKKKLHNEEEQLRKKRNDVIQLMQNAIKISSDTKTEQSETDFVPGIHSTPGSGKTERNAVNIQEGKSSEESTSSTSSSSSDVRAKQKKSNCSDSEEILILPSPVKAKPPEIIIVDDMDENASETVSNRNSLAAREIAPNFPNQGSCLYDTKNLTAHTTVVNCIVVFEDFVYTCSNDNSAKRFSLKDTSQTTIYLHTAKNVTEISVEKVQNEALVFTSCSNRVLSLFIASNGTKIKTFFQSSSIKSICKGWGKFYAGMEDGTVNVYNWKYEEKEFVKTHSSTHRIATVHQGGLHILIILSTDGHVSLRDAKTSLLIRVIKATVKIPAWLTVHNDFVCLSSSDRTVSVLDIQSGRLERKMQLGHSHATGLAVCDDHIFTISYSGIICCVNKDSLSDVTLFYGAGKTGLTCIHIYQNWVFTGNRKGDISVFQFNPYSRFSCKIGKCKSVYGSKEHLTFHFELQHLKKKNLALCQWEKCPFIFPVHYSIHDKVNHLKKHILPLPRGSVS